MILIRAFFILCLGFPVICFGQIIETVAGTGNSGYSGNGGPALAADLDKPWDIDVDSQGNVYYSEHTNSVVRKVDAQTGIISNIFGNGTTGFGTSGEPGPEFELYTPGYIHLDETNNYLYVADYTAHKIYKMNLADSTVTVVAGNGSPGYSPDGTLAYQAQINTPLGICQGADGLIYFVDNQNYLIRRINTDGTIQTVAGILGSDFITDGLAANATFEHPYGLEADANNNLYVAEVTAGQIRKIDLTLDIVTTVAGSGGTSFVADGLPPLGSTFIVPHSFAVEPNGNIYIGDVDNNRVRYIDFNAGTVYTVSGNGSAGYSGDQGDPLQAQMDGPFGVDIAMDGFIYVTEIDNHIVRRFGSCEDPEFSGINIIDATYNDTTLCAGVVSLALDSADLNGADEWQWYEGICGDTPLGTGAILNFDLQNSTTVSVRGEGGCTSNADCETIELILGDCTDPIDERNITAFSPNNDGINDVLFIHEAELTTENIVTIYNRWGDEVRIIRNYNNVDVVWDGKNEKGNWVEGGTYFFIFESVQTSSKSWVNVVK